MSDYTERGYARLQQIMTRLSESQIQNLKKITVNWIELDDTPGAYPNVVIEFFSPAEKGSST